MLSKSEKLQYCSGCRNNFYNGNNPMKIKECWSLKTAKLVKRFRIYWWTPMDKASNFTEVKVLSCYNDLENGHGYAYLTDIPSHLKQEWKELQKSKGSVIHDKQ
jgi:hypothetical protein